MKIKNDFITNSSSTSYLICIPNNFNVEEFVNKRYNRVQGERPYYYHNTEEELIELVKNFILSERGYLEYDNRNDFNDLSFLFKDEIIYSEDTSSERGELSVMRVDNLLNKITKMLENFNK